MVIKLEISFRNAVSVGFSCLHYNNISKLNFFKITKVFKKKVFKWTIFLKKFSKNNSLKESENSMDC